MTIGLQLIIGLFIAMPAMAFETQTIPSPDRMFLAVLSSSISAISGETSSFIVMKASSGVALHAEGYRLPDDPHGGKISSAAWTTDSRFFVYILENPKGPAPSTHPIFFWDSRDNQLISLDKHLGGITTGFVLIGPDIIQAHRLSKNPAEGHFSVSLSSVASNFYGNERAKCELGGGQFRPVGRRRHPICTTPFSDAGKQCTDSTQCKGGCFLEGWRIAPTEESAAKGICRRDNSPVGCFIEIKKGRTQPGLCAD